MKKQILLVAVLFALTSCTTIGNFWDSIFGKEKYQPIPANKRTPLLNQYQGGAAAAPFAPPAFAGGGPAPFGGAPQPPQAPDPFGAPVPYADAEPAPAQPPFPGAPVPRVSPPPTQFGNPYAGEVLPPNRRVPEFNEQARNSQLASSAKAPVFVPPKLPELPASAPAPKIAPAPRAASAPNGFVPPKLPEAAPRPPQNQVAGDFPRLADVPPQAPAPRPLNNDPRVADLQKDLAQSRSAQGNGAPPPFVPPPPPSIDDDAPAAVPMPKVAKAEIPGNVQLAPPVDRRPSASAPPRYLPPLPTYEPEPMQGTASTDVSQLRPISSAFDGEGSDQPAFIPNKIEPLKTDDRSKLRRIRAGGGAGNELVRHSALN